MSIIIFIVVLIILILVHEFGHFITAKRFGMRVDEFGLGFPPRLFGIKRGETIYSINWIPFGGFVKIYGEDGDSREKPKSFGSKSISARLSVIVAGVVMNIIFAFILLVRGNIFGLRIGLFNKEMMDLARDKKIQIVEVVVGSPAEKAGLTVLDEIIVFEIDGSRRDTVRNIEELQDFTDEHK